MAKPIPYRPNRTGRKGLWIALASWGMLVLCLIAVEAELIPIAIGFLLWAMTVVAGITYCVAGYRDPPRTAAVIGLVILGLNLVLAGLLFLAGLTAAGLAQFR